MEIRTLKNRWHNLFKTLAEDALIEEGFSELIHKYSEKHRHYHNINHIKECQTALDQVQTYLQDSFSLEAAVWFHDVIYDPKQSENEHHSAEYAKSFLIDTAADMMTIRKIEHLINLTKHPSSPENSDENYLIDIDLLILGTDSESYDKYRSAIRKEYSFVPDFLFKKGRKKLLKSFLASRRIYHTDYFFSKFENQARSNIKREQSELNGS